MPQAQNQPPQSRRSVFLEWVVGLGSQILLVIVVYYDIISNGFANSRWQTKLAIGEIVALLVLGVILLARRSRRPRNR